MKNIKTLYKGEGIYEIGKYGALCDNDLINLINYVETGDVLYKHPYRIPEGSKVFISKLKEINGENIYEIASLNRVENDVIGDKPNIKRGNVYYSDEWGLFGEENVELISLKESKNNKKQMNKKLIKENLFEDKTDEIFGHVTISITGNGEIKTNAIRYIKQSLRNLMGKRTLIVDGKEINPYQ